jgi:hypothetical protein
MFPPTYLVPQIKEDWIFSSIPHCAIPDALFIELKYRAFFTPCIVPCCLDALTVKHEIFPPRNATFNYLVSHNFYTGASVPRTCKEWTWRSEKGEECGCGSIVFAVGCRVGLCEGVSFQL